MVFGSFLHNDISALRFEERIILQGQRNLSEPYEKAVEFSGGSKLESEFLWLPYFRMSCYIWGAPGSLIYPRTYYLGRYLVNC